MVSQDSQVTLALTVNRASPGQQVLLVLQDHRALKVFRVMSVIEV